MRALISLCFVMILSGGASSDDYEIHIDFDPPNRLSEITAEPYETVDAYICLTSGSDDPFAGVTFRLTDLEEEYPGAVAPPAFTNLLPGDLAIGDWRTGITLASTECMTDYMVSVACLSMLVLTSEPFCIEIHEHPKYPSWVVGCERPLGGLYYSCIRGSGHVNGATCSGGDCPDGPYPVPTEATTLDSVKTLLR